MIDVEGEPNDKLFQFTWGMMMEVNWKKWKGEKTESEAWGSCVLDRLDSTAYYFVSGIRFYWIVNVL